MNHPTDTPSGRRHGERGVAFSRRFHAPIDAVWAAVTESDRLARWYGTWSGDPASGEIVVAMNSSGDEGSSPARIRECTPPRALRLDLGDPDGNWWELDLELTETEDGTELTLIQDFADPTLIPMVGPGWDYYLDRLVAAETGGNPDELHFERDYYPALAEHYQRLVDDRTR